MPVLKCPKCRRTVNLPTVFKAADMTCRHCGDGMGLTNGPLFPLTTPKQRRKRKKKGGPKC